MSVKQKSSGDHHAKWLMRHTLAERPALTVHRWRLPDSSVWVHGPSEATYISPIWFDSVTTDALVCQLTAFLSSYLVSTFYIFPYQYGNIPNVSVKIRTHFKILFKNVSETSVSFTIAWLTSSTICLINTYAITMTFNLKNQNYKTFSKSKKNFVPSVCGPTKKLKE